MSEYQIIYWRDIPAQVIVKKSRREQIKLPLNERFEKAIDMAAMRTKSHSEDDYLADWVKSTPIEIPDGDMEAQAKEIAQKLEAELDDAKLKLLIKQGGYLEQK